MPNTPYRVPYPEVSILVSKKRNPGGIGTRLVLTGLVAELVNDKDDGFIRGWKRNQILINLGFVFDLRPVRFDRLDSCRTGREQKHEEQQQQDGETVPLQLNLQMSMGWPDHPIYGALGAVKVTLCPVALSVTVIVKFVPSSVISMVESPVSVSYTHLTLPTKRIV